MGHKLATNSSQIEPSHLLDKKEEEDLHDRSAPLDT